MQCAPLTTATMCWLSVCILLAAAVCDSAATAQSPTVHTKNGQLIGSIETTAIEKREFFAFRGIRYAKPPVGPLRFKVSATTTFAPRADGGANQKCGTYKSLSFALVRARSGDEGSTANWTMDRYTECNRFWCKMPANNVQPVTVLGRGGLPISQRLYTG